MNTSSYFLPPKISKFVAMTDIHQINKYLSSMDSDYDFNLLVGDYSYGGMPHEFARSFKTMHQKPVIMAVGNHDILGSVDQLVMRETNYYQKIGQLGFYFIYVLNSDNILNCQWVNKSRVDAGIKFLNDNMHLSAGDEHVFIVTHQAVYSTGQYGSNPYFAEKMEAFLDSHQNSKIRAVFSGHDHIFASFKRNNQFFFVNGASGGPIDDMYNFGSRSWPTAELNGPLAQNDNSQLGYGNHLSSYMKFTRTEILLETKKINYVVKDLDTNTVINTFEQVIE
ncbi:Alkaline_phosphatase [Hexamita inflata]|uniref:Alkaline phosphatase n=1 Tax=Hexamita inflata TaxID=28002 RepID=A0AA86UZ41_9EUKA|nr:Alkaline phosphatase [Hexamita inflata]